MKISARDIEMKIDAFVAAVDGVFTLADVLNHVAPPDLTDEDTERLDSIIIDHLNSNPNLFSDREGENFIQRKLFLNGRKFYVTPDIFEISNGLMFPGHRFSPYCADQIFPSEIILLDNGRNVGRREFTIGIQEAVTYHMLLGAEQMFDFFVADHEDNAVILNSSKAASGSVKLTVVELTDFYRKHEFQEGDAIEISIEDWENGRFSMAYVSGEKRNSREKAQWIEKFAEAVEEVIETYGNYLDIPEQLAHAVYIAGAELMDKPAASLDEFYADSDRIQIGYVSGATVLTMKTLAQEEEEGDWELPEEVMVSQGMIGTLAEILKDAGSIMQPVEIETVMMDQLFHDDRNFDVFFQRCFGGETLKFADEAQEAVFMNFIEDLWENRMECYNRFEDDSKGPVRERLLEITEERLNWLRYLGDMEVDLEKLQEDEQFSRLVSGSLHCNSLCELLNSETHFVSASEVENIMESLDNLAELQHQYIENLNNTIAVAKK